MDLAERDVAVGVDVDVAEERVELGLGELPPELLIALLPDRAVALAAAGGVRALAA